jgi:hypothetical protein
LRNGPFVGYTVAETQCRIVTGGFHTPHAAKSNTSKPLTSLCPVLRFSQFF